MTDLVSLIKEAIMNAPTRSFDGKMNYQAMAEAAAKAIENAHLSKPRQGSTLVPQTAMIGISK